SLRARRPRSQQSTWLVNTAVLTLVSGLLSGFLFFTRLRASGQSKQTSKSTNVSAGVTNAQLRNDLNWIFGGKPQRGWYIYTPLINRLISNKNDFGSPQFASAVARWQRKAGLKP